MSVTASAFSPEIWRTSASLQDYLSGEAADKKLEKQLIQASKEQEPEAEVWLLCNLTYAVFLKAASCFLYFAGWVRWSCELDIQAKQLIFSDNRELGVDCFGDDFLAPSLNGYSPEAIDLYALPAIPIKEVPLLSGELYFGKTHFDFNRNTGFCVGESYWFIRSYLKTQHLFTNHRTHVKALGKLFSSGAPIEAALSHKLVVSLKYLQLKESYDRIEVKDPAPQEISWDKRKINAVVEAFKTLEPGAYHVHAPKHSMAYVCTEKGEGYFFEPNLGTAAIHTEAGLNKMAKKILYYQAYRDTFEGDRLVQISKVDLVEPND